MANHNVNQLLDELLACWPGWTRRRDYYLSTVVPEIQAGRAKVGSFSHEGQADVVVSLRQVLTPEQWDDLAALLLRRDQQRRRELRERERKNALAAEEQRRREEATQQRREQERKQAAAELARTREATKARRASLVDRIRQWMQTDFLRVDQRLNADRDARLITTEELSELKTRFVREWTARTLELELDSDQAQAVAAVHGNVHVIARAGSGKTRTLVTRAIFLQQHCRVPARELLLLAFNKKAAKEMHTRLMDALGDGVPHVMTFHALAYAIVHPEENLVYDDPSTDQLGVSREVQAVIDEVKQSAEHGPQVQALMLDHYREDYERIVEGRFEWTMDEFLEHRRALPRESLNGEYVKSFGEKVIANALFEHSVPYRYERNHKRDGFNYKPDFTLETGKSSGVVIEYFGMAGDADYDKQAQGKREYWNEKDGWKLLEYTPDDLREHDIDGFVARLLQDLADVGILSERRSEEEIWNLISGRALNSFAKAMGAFVGRCRSAGLDRSGLQAEIDAHTPCSRSEQRFLDIGSIVFAGYLQRLEAQDQEDFSGLVWRAVERLRAGQTDFSRDQGRERGNLGLLRYIMVDEFQDFSLMFYELLDAARHANPAIEFFGVGDDWQAINGFAGSDLKYFDDFAQYFPGATTITLRTNYRSPISVVRTGNALMRKNGTHGKPSSQVEGNVWRCDITELQPSAAERDRHGWDEVTPSVLRLVHQFLTRDMRVVLLSRRNDVPWQVNYDDAAPKVAAPLDRFLTHVRSFLPDDDHGRVSISTVHKFKGLEQQAVIVLDALNGTYPLVHPTWRFFRMFGDNLGSLVADERRLFYVALSRPQHSLALITDHTRESPFIQDIQNVKPLNSLTWETLRPPPSLDQPRYEIRVFNAHDVKDELKALNYTWVPKGRYWAKTVMVEDFSIERLKTRPWNKGAVKAAVYSERGELVHQG